MESSISQVAALVKRYVDGTIALHELEDTYLPLLWDADEDSDVVQFLGHVNNLIAERGQGDRTEESVREELANAIRPFAQSDSMAVRLQDPPAQVRIQIAGKIPNEQIESFVDSASSIQTLRKPAARSMTAYSGTTTFGALARLVRVQA
jgi:hypothetical protein